METLDLFGNAVSAKSYRCSATVQDGAILLKTPYDPAAVAQIKAIPASHRKWDPDHKAWLISMDYATTVRSIVKAYWGEELVLPKAAAVDRRDTRLLEVHYIGACKDRDGESSAFGMNAAGDWCAIFPETVLRTWFDATASTAQSSNLFALLGVGQNADSAELQSGYRRMARQWHPDVCKEDNAHEMFLRIQEAYTLLNDPKRRARYSAGLALEQTVKHTQELDQRAVQIQFRSPLRCGLIYADGAERLGRFVVAKILAWEDIVNPRGQTLVVSWPENAKQPTKIWA